MAPDRPVDPTTDEHWAATARAEREVYRLRQRLRDERTRRRALLRALGEERARADLALAIKSDTAVTDFAIPPRGGKREGCAVMIASDWHYGETIETAAVNERNSYDVEIARRSAGRFFRGCGWLVEHLSLGDGGYHLQDGLLLLLGDMVTGYLRDEDLESCALSPTESVRDLLGILDTGIRYLLEHTPLDRLHVVCVHGNHGRTTPEIRVKTGSRNSYEWLMYHVLADRLADEPRVSWQIADGEQVYTTVYGHTVRALHGDSIRYRGGVGGISVPLLRALPRWDTVRHADLTVMGHLHQWRDFDCVIVNGSLVGYSPYAIRIGAPYEPARQGFFVLDRDRGKTLTCPVWVRGGEAC